jgi:plasmid maintenance system antidote protein VapI
LIRRIAGAATGALLVAVLAGPSARAESPEDVFDSACRAYEQGHWDAAADGFRSLLRYGLADPRLEYNLANAEYKRGHLGEAILHYERARRLNPSDADTAANLAIARSKLRDIVEEENPSGLVHAIRSAQDQLGVSAQTWMLLICVWLVAAIVTWCGSRAGGFTPGWGWSLAGLLVVTLVVFLSLRATWVRLDGTPRAIILKPSVDALAGPGVNNASLFTLHEGIAVTIQSEREGWLQVSLPNGLTGWVVRDAAERI